MDDGIKPCVEILQEGNFGHMRLRRDLVTWPDDSEQVIEYRIARHELVSIAALDEKGRLIFVRQYRHPVGGWTVELPGGGLVEGESPWEGALRILREETGFSALAGNIYPLPGPLSLAPSAMQHKVHSIFAHDAARVTEPKISGKPNPLETLLLPAKNVIRDPAETLGEYGHVPLQVLGTLMLARRAIREAMKELE